MYNDPSKVGRILGIAFAELAPFIPKNVSYVGHDESFSPMNDMPEELKKLMVENRPNLVRPIDVFEVEGDTEKTRNLISKIFKENHIKADWVPPGIIVDRFSNAYELIEKIGNDHAKWLANIATAKEDFDFYSSDEKIDDWKLRDLLRELDEAEITAIGLSFMDHYPDEIAEEFEDDFDPSDIDDIMTIMEYVDDYQLRSIGSQAVEDGNRAGQETEMYNALMSALNDLNYVWYEQTPAEEGQKSDVLNWENYDQKPKYLQEGKVLVVIPTKEIAKLSSNIDELETAADDWVEFFEIEMKLHNGDYYGHDDDTAKESFKDRLYEDDFIDEELVSRAKEWLASRGQA